MKSKPYRRGGKLFRYDFDSCIVECIAKDRRMLADNAEWMEKHGHPLWDLDEDGYWTVESAGLMPENWKDKSSRNGYLDMWIEEMEEESRIMAEQFIRWG